MEDSDLARGEKRLMGGVGQAARAAYTDTCLETSVGGPDRHCQGEMGAPLRLDDSPQPRFRVMANLARNRLRNINLSRDANKGKQNTPDRTATHHLAAKPPADAP